MEVRLHPEGRKVHKQLVRDQSGSPRGRSKKKGGNKKPEPGTGTIPVMAATPTAMGFLELVNRRLDHVKAYNSQRHYTDHFYMAKKWIGEWEKLSCEEVSRDKIQKFLLKRAEVSPYTANKDLRYLRALFNFGISRNWITENPTRGFPSFQWKSGSNISHPKRMS